MNADGTRQHRIAPANNFARPAWSPDGSKIAFLGGWPNVHVDVINADGTNLRRLAPPVSYKNADCRPTWSPDGEHIAFSPTNPFVDADLGGIYLMNPSGRNVTHVKGTTGSACGISWQRTPA
jgi:Tol biopolymer transport system component